MKEKENERKYEVLVSKHLSIINFRLHSIDVDSNSSIKSKDKINEASSACTCEISRSKSRTRQFESSLVAPAVKPRSTRATKANR